MTTVFSNTRGSILVGLLWLGCWPIAAYGQNVLRGTYNGAGMDAYRQGRYAKAEKFLLASLKEGEGFGARELCLAMTLNNLGGRGSSGGFGSASGAGGVKSFGR